MLGGEAQLFVLQFPCWALARLAAPAVHGSQIIHSGFSVKKTSCSLSRLVISFNVQHESFCQDHWFILKMSLIKRTHFKFTLII